jgi:trigger factor
VNVSVEHLSPCKKLLRVEIDAQAAQAELDSVAKTFQQRSNLPGFRPGKAPRDLVFKAFGTQIDAEAKRILIGKAYQQALRDQNLRPTGHPDIEEAPWEHGQSLAFTATVETEADFEVPDYKGLPVRRDSRAVTEEDMARALRALQEQKASFVDQPRPVQPGDFVVVNYTSTCEGKPITEFAPAARGLTQQTNFWLHVDPGSFIPGFTEQLVGASANEKRTVSVDFPADFVTKEVAGKQGTFEVDIVQVKEKQLPALDDEFAKSYGAENLEMLRAGVRRDLENELRTKQKRQVRDQLVATLLGRVSLELPESLVQFETRNVVYDIVKANQDRGVPKEAIDGRKDEIYSVANNSARERVKAMIVLNRIAEKEGITASDDEVTHHVLQLAAHYRIKPEKLAKQLREQGALTQIRRQIIEAKVLDALDLYAQVEDAPH